MKKKERISNHIDWKSKRKRRKFTKTTWNSMIFYLIYLLYDWILCKQKENSLWTWGKQLYCVMSSSCSCHLLQMQLIVIKITIYLLYVLKILWIHKFRWHDTVTFYRVWEVSQPSPSTTPHIISYRCPHSLVTSVRGCFIMSVSSSFLNLVDSRWDGIGQNGTMLAGLAYFMSFYYIVNP